MSSNRGTWKSAWGEIHFTWPDMSNLLRPQRFFHTDFTVGSGELEQMRQIASGITGVKDVQGQHSTFRLVFEPGTTLEEIKRLSSSFACALQEHVNAAQASLAPPHNTLGVTARFSNELSPETLAAMAVNSSVGPYRDSEG